MAKLIKICMNEDPGKRPTFDVIIPILEKMKNELRKLENDDHKTILSKLNIASLGTTDLFNFSFSTNKHQHFYKSK